MYDFIIICVLFNMPTLGVSGDEPATGMLAKDGDYIGCYAHGCLNFDYNLPASESVTPDSCTASCKNLGFPVASLSQGKKCSCSCHQTCLAKPLGDMNCATPCQDLTRFCGGYVAASVYRVRSMNTINITCYEVYDEYSDIPILPDESDALPDSRRILLSILISIFVTIFFCAVVVTTAILVHRWLHKTQNTESTTVEEAHAEERPSIETNNYSPVNRQEGTYSRKSQIASPLKNSQQSTKPSIKPRVSMSSTLKDITGKQQEISTALKDITRKSQGSSAALKDITRKSQGSSAALKDITLKSQGSSAALKDITIKSPGSSAALKDITIKSQGSSAAPKDIRKNTRDSSAADDFYAEAHYDGTSIASSIKRAREDTSDGYYINPDLLDHDYIYPEVKPSHFQRKFLNSRISKDGYMVPELPLPKPPSNTSKKYSSARVSRSNNKDMVLSSGSHDKDDEIYYEI